MQRPSVFENVILPASYLIDGFVECRILGWGSFTCRILKVSLHYLSISRYLIEKSDTALIPNPVLCILLVIWKLLGLIASIMKSMICLVVSLFFSFIVLDTWWDLSKWRQLSFSLGTFSCTINLIIIFSGLPINWILDLLKWFSIFAILSVSHLIIFYLLGDFPDFIW